MFVFDKTKADETAKQENSKLATFALQMAVVFGTLAVLRAA
jgi:hypothetical protein